MADEDPNASATDDEGKPGTAAGSNGDGAGSAADPGDGDSGTETVDYKDQAEKWKKLSRQNEKNLRDAQSKIKEFEDKTLSESQRLEKERDAFKSTAETSSTELERYNIAIESAPEHATLAQLRKVAKRIRGDSAEALEADAKELWEDYAPAQKSPPTAGKPKERLKGGADPDDEPDEMDPAKIVAAIPRAR